MAISALSGSALTEGIRYFFQRKKDNAEAEITLSGGWKEYADKLELRLETLEREYWPLKEENIKLKAKVAEMEREMKQIKQQFT